MNDRQRYRRGSQVVRPGSAKAPCDGSIPSPASLSNCMCSRGIRGFRTETDTENPLLPLLFDYGISFISVEQAKKSLHEEIPSWNFDIIKRTAKDRWNEVLGQIQVEGGTPEKKRVFYTSLYRCYERMVSHDKPCHVSRPFVEALGIKF